MVRDYGNVQAFFDANRQKSEDIVSFFLSNLAEVKAWVSSKQYDAILMLRYNFSEVRDFWEEPRTGGTAVHVQLFSEIRCVQAEFDFCLSGAKNRSISA